ncbi:LytTR family DNA-binding domain-containing protein [Spirosoma sp. 209]|uniref:LytR/AlgR family response regulator transcription factor n=1 Tax=Spirosoma sp. 209 TaxID=1955701 RepID=UPI00098D19ED|nr:LytTR family DNA-binding domain-containing protein [Spirosoma sp. 209]
MLHLLRQPYPSSESAGRQVRKAAFIGLFVGLFLLTFEPFGINLWNTDHKSLKLLGFGLVTFVVTALNFTVWNRLFPRQFSDERWTVGREILLITGNILLIALANRLYMEWLLRLEGLSYSVNWVSMILITFLVGLFPTTGVVLLNYVRQLKKYSESAAQLPVHPPVQPGITPITPSPTGHSLTLVADNDRDTLSLDPADLLFIESSDNYCTVVYWKDTDRSKPAKVLLRSSLSRMAAQIEVPHIVRCHRSYVVNLDRVERVTGNAQGYKLHLAGGQLAVPVSRQYNDTLVAELKSL